MYPAALAIVVNTYEVQHAARRWPCSSVSPAG